MLLFEFLNKFFVFFVLSLSALFQLLLLASELITHALAGLFLLLLTIFDFFVLLE
jgi:hypothetical protein